MPADAADGASLRSSRQSVALPTHGNHSHHESDAAYNLNQGATGKPTKKKRRVVKTSDKKYQCPTEDCGKSYSRAEHLYRHQLNHAPKQIYRCDFPGCDRHFVRADLCARHKERHTAKGSHLQRKDAFMLSQAQRPATSASDDTVNSQPQSQSNRPDTASPLQSTHTLPPTSIPNGYPSSHHPAPELPNGHVQQFQGQQVTGLAPVNTTDGTMSLDPQLSSQYAAYQNGPPSAAMSSTSRRFSYGSAMYERPQQPDAFNPTQPLPIHSMHPPSMSPSNAGASAYSQPAYPSPSVTSLRSPTGFQNMQHLSSFTYGQNFGPTSAGRPGNPMSPPSMDVADPQGYSNNRPPSMGDFNVMDPMNFGYAMPVFGGDGFNRSPSVIMDDSFLNSLFGGHEPMSTTPPPPVETTLNLPNFDTPLPKVEAASTPGDQSLHGRGSESAVSTLDGLDHNMRESVISESKQRRLAALVRAWPQIEDNPGRRDKDQILAGDTSKSSHVLSLQNLKAYITSYWTNVHCQMPILHRPTFNPETCPDLLLLAMCCLGATSAQQDQSDGTEPDCAELGFFMAYHIRWEVFKDAEFRPTAKLWTFQTMLLLELFEKMYSTRALHERAHIHHATTLTVMRRGSSLIGRNATDTPNNGSDPTRTPPGPDGSINTSGQNTTDAFWNRWITAEATRRVAFAAFIIDSTHSTLFGHSAAMSPHDLRLPLPCDEALWSATSSIEVQRVEASLAANGFKSTSFLEGLRKTLNGQKVRTNAFGRVILMSGLLNISWHMNQRDLQVSSLGAASTLGSQIRWRSPLTRAFDYWRRDFDEHLAKGENWLQICSHKPNDRESVGHRDHVFESRTCLHSLAHMAMHVDINDCLVFAGADHVLGRVITDADRAVVQRRMREAWAPSARARDATFYALRFLSEVLIPEEVLHRRPGPNPTLLFTYEARDDYLLNRPWVLYFALLIVWSYGYALDGPLNPASHTLTSRELRIYDMQQYLIRMGGQDTPEDLEQQKDRNSCLGLLLLLRESFQHTRWELLSDASDVLGSCIDMLLPGNSEPSGKHLTGV